jgi:ubiquinone/menaquinone biosynthesis C-methylase UbiE
LTGQEIQRRAREQFRAAGDAYVQSETHRLGKDLAMLVEVAEPRPDMRVLDIATGGGHTAIALAPLVGEVAMLDLTPEMLVHARKFARETGVEPVGVIAAAAESIPFADESFNLVTCRIAPHHFADVQSFVDEVARVLMPGGAFVLIDSLAPDIKAYDEFINKVEQWRDPSHVRAYSMTEWTEFLGRAGLRLETSEIIVKRHEFASWTERSRMAPGEPEALSDWILTSDEACKAHFSVDVQDGKVASFNDFKVLLRARK